MDKSKFKHPVLGCRSRTSVIKRIRGHPRDSNVCWYESTRTDWIHYRLY